MGSVKNAASFSLQPSITQTWIDSLWWLSSLMIMGLLYGTAWLWLALGPTALLGLCWMVWRYRRRPLAVLSWQAGQWYLNQGQRLAWRTGSVRRASVIIWQYGRWPWQRLYIRPDSLAPGQFRELLVALAS